MNMLQVNMSIFHIIGGQKMERAEPVEDLVEVVFKWINTKDTAQQVIVLITSLVCIKMSLNLYNSVNKCFGEDNR